MNLVKYNKRALSGKVLRLSKHTIQTIAGAGACVLNVIISSAGKKSCRACSSKSNRANAVILSDKPVQLSVGTGRS